MVKEGVQKDVGGRARAIVELATNRGGLGIQSLINEGVDDDAIDEAIKRARKRGGRLDDNGTRLTTVYKRLRLFADDKYVAEILGKNEKLWTTFWTKMQAKLLKSVDLSGDIEDVKYEALNEMTL